MKTALFVLFALPLAAQTPPAENAPAQAAPAAQAQSSAPPAQAAAPAASAQAAAPAASAQAESPAPPAENWITGSVDFGYRWISGVGGDYDTYRSVVNLGEGPKLFGLDLDIRPPSSHLVDRIDVRASSWGGDPYNTARLEVQKDGIYRFTWDYRNIAYYDFLPSFADPTLNTGLFLDQRGYDTFRRTSDLELTLFPGHRIIPYFAYSRSAGRGDGTTNITAQDNEYTVPDTISDYSNVFRAGVRLEMSHYHLTIEQGAMSFADNQQVGGGTSPNLGNVQTPILGQQLSLTSGEEAYAISGSAVFSKALLSANPVSWADLYGQFLFSQPHTDTHFTETDSGNFVDLTTLAFYNGLSGILDSQARQPHTSGNFAAELRPWRRLRIIESWLTDRLHDAGSALLLDQLLLSGQPLTASSLAAADRLVMNYNQEQVDVLFDITSRFILRGGYRFVWGDATIPPALVLGNLPDESGLLRRHVGLAGLTYRSTEKLRVSLDYEGSPGDQSYFRTSLNDYQRARIQARYQALASLLLTAHFGVLKNENPAPGVNFDYLSRDNTLSAYWTPAGGKRLNILAEYSRTTLSSDITYRDPGTGASDLSSYRECAHTGTLLAEIPLPARGGLQPKLSLGGSLFDSGGTSPVRYYQPFGKILAPLGKRVQWNAEWRWYSLSQPLYLYEGFRTHQFTTGFRLTM